MQRRGACDVGDVGERPAKHWRRRLQGLMEAPDQDSGTMHSRERLMRGCARQTVCDSGTGGPCYLKRPSSSRSLHGCPQLAMCKKASKLVQLGCCEHFLPTCRLRRCRWNLKQCSGQSGHLHQNFAVVCNSGAGTTATMQPRIASLTGWVAVGFCRMHTNAAWDRGSLTAHKYATPVCRYNSIWQYASG